MYLVYAYKEKLYILSDETSILTDENYLAIKREGTRLFSTEDLLEALNYARNIINGREIIIRIC